MLNFSFSEQEVFETFLGIMQNLNLAQLYGFDFDLLRVHIDNLKIALQEQLPQLLMKLEYPDLTEEEITNRIEQKNTENAGSPALPLLSYFASFYLTLFMNQTSLEISHLFLVSFSMLGYHIVDHILIGLLAIHQETIMQMEDLREVIQFVTKHMVNTSVNYEGSGDLLSKESRRVETGIASLLLQYSVELFADEAVAENKLLSQKFLAADLC